MNAAEGKHPAFIGFPDWHFVRRTDSPLVNNLLYLIGGEIQRDVCRKGIPLIRNWSAIETIT